MDFAGFTVLALLFGAMLTLSVTSHDKHPVVRLFTARPLRFMGKISYAMYVFHIPIMIVLAGYWESIHLEAFGIPLVRQFTFLAVSGTCTVLAGVISWHFFEKHFLGLKKFFTSSRPAPEKVKAG